MKTNNGVTFVELLFALAFLVILLGVGYELVIRATCNRGRTVPTGGMDCWGSDFHQHCEPTTKFVCDD